MGTDIRVGNGFDIHRFHDASPNGRVLVLGGVPFPGERTLVGHSAVSYTHLTLPTKRIV